MDCKVRRTQIRSGYYQSFVTRSEVLHQEITCHSFTAQRLKTLLRNDSSMDFSLALAKFGIFGSKNHQLIEEDRVSISRTRRAIDLQEQELIQLALLEERQKSA
jgi:hypothetical protein